MKLISLEHAPYRHLDYLIKKVSIEFAKGIREELTREELATVKDKIASHTFLDENSCDTLDLLQSLKRKIELSDIWDKALSTCGYDPTTWNSDSEEDLELFYESTERAIKCKFNIDVLTNEVQA
tara:strand:- start:673 stop:1044 length:372 start_codon:yes stop_codon:yes gene_type:complete